MSAIVGLSSKERDEKVRATLTAVKMACDQYLAEINAKPWYEKLLHGGHSGGREIVEKLKRDINAYEDNRLRGKSGNFYTHGVSIISSQSGAYFPPSDPDGAGAGIRRSALSLFDAAKTRSAFFNKAQLAGLLDVLGDEEYREWEKDQEQALHRTPRSYCDYTNTVLKGCELFLKKENPFCFYSEFEDRQAIRSLQSLLTKHRFAESQETAREVYQAVINLRSSAKKQRFLSEDTLLGLLNQIGAHRLPKPRGRIESFTK